MSINKHKNMNSMVKIRLMDVLNAKSLSTLSKFGYIYKDKNTGKIKIRVYKK